MKPTKNQHPITIYNDMPKERAVENRPTKMKMRRPKVNFSGSINEYVRKPHRFGMKLCKFYRQIQPASLSRVVILYEMRHAVQKTIGDNGVMYLKVGGAVLMFDKSKYEDIAIVRMFVWYRCPSRAVIIDGQCSFQSHVSGLSKCCGQLLFIAACSPAAGIIYSF
jgi:hypothetical protein